MTVAGRDLSASRGGLESWLSLLGGVFQLPFRILGLSADLMLRAGREAGRAMESGLSGGGLGTPAARPSPHPSSVPAARRTIPAAAGPAPPVNAVATQSQEDPKMSCDRDLSGTDLKIIEYTIVSVDPDLDNDDDRVLQGPVTISTTDDMTDADFTAWVIALYAQRSALDEEERRGHRIRRVVEHDEKQYLRVCYWVQCRLVMPEANYERQQVEALRDINRTLERGKGGGGDLAKTR